MDLNPSEYFNPPEGFDPGGIVGLYDIGLILAICIGIVCIVFALLFILMKLQRVIRGKGEITNRHWKLFAVSICAGILLSGSGWIGMMKTGHEVLVEPSKQIIIENQQKLEVEKQEREAERQAERQAELKEKAEETLDSAKGVFETITDTVKEKLDEIW